MFKPAGAEGIPGGVEILDGEIELNAGRVTVELPVTNLGDRPIQVGSHYHFIETNPALRFDRGQAYGKRLDIPAGTAVRFEPGETKTVRLVEIAGDKVIEAATIWPTERSLRLGKVLRWQRVKRTRDSRTPELNHGHKIKRGHYADMFGPTTGRQSPAGRHVALSRSGEGSHRLWR